jgi:hypothetical protein
MSSRIDFVESTFGQLMLAKDEHERFRPFAFHIKSLHQSFRNFNVEVEKMT